MGLYTEDSIESINPKEHVQLRPSMYCGDTSTPNQLMLEAFSNALDEHNIGHGNIIKIDINEEDGTCRCEDEGQGFLVNCMRLDGETVLQASFDVLHTSGKYSDDGVYNGTSLGLNGCGLKLITFLSSWLYVTTWRGGKAEHIRFKDGEFVERIVYDDDDHRNGTLIYYKPDPRYFESDKTSVEYFERFFQEVACLCPGLTIVLNGVEISHDGLNDLIDLKIGKDEEIIPKRFFMESDRFKLAMTFAQQSASSIYAYVNHGRTQSGPHIAAIKTVLTKVLNSWARQNKVLKEREKNLDGASVQEGLVLVCNIDAKDVKYNAQVKDDIVDVDTSFSSDMSRELGIWLDNNPACGRAIVEKALLARRAAEAARKAREAVKNSKRKDKVFKLPTKLTDCWSKKRDRCELLICEGLSAATGLVAARNGEFQGVYGVRGKMLSIRKSGFKKALENQEINNIIQALGLEIDYHGKRLIYDENKLRYGKIIAVADADYDGYAIENLLFNILWYLCPELIIHGHVYSSVPPLFRVTTKKNEYVYLKDSLALKSYKKKNSKNIQFIGRMKGLGECNPEELYSCLLNPETRNIVKLTVSDVNRAEQLFEDLYGTKVEPRVRYLLEHAEEANV